MSEVSADIARQVEREVAAALIACPTESQVLLARPNDLSAFLRWSVQSPTHEVRLHRVVESGTRANRTWTIEPIAGENAYSLTITLPRLIEQRLSEETDRRTRTLAAKSELGGQLEILWDPQGDMPTYGVAGPRVFRLVFSRPSFQA